MRRAGAVAITEADVMSALRDCYDAEVKLNIVDLGLVYGVTVEPDEDAPGAGITGVPPRQRVTVKLMLISPESAAEGQIVAQIEGRLAAFETVSSTVVELVWGPQWTVDRISEAGRRTLGARIRSIGPHGLVQIQTNPGKRE